MKVRPGQIWRNNSTNHDFSIEIIDDNRAVVLTNKQGTLFLEVGKIIGIPHIHSWILEKDTYEDVDKLLNTYYEI